MASPAPHTILLNNGTQTPAISFGTYACLETEGIEAMKHAVDAGYRSFDTAAFYQNEREVGEALRAKIEEGVVKREDLYVVTKVWNTAHKPEDVEAAARKSNETLGLDYIDLYLIHWPMAIDIVPGNIWSIVENGETANIDVDYLETYKAMEKLVDAGLVKSIGVSNFNSQQLDRLLANCRIKPTTHQIEASPLINQKQLVQYCKERDIAVMGYCALGINIFNQEKPKFFTDDKYLEIAQKYNKSAGQVALRYLVDRGVIPLSKSVTKKRIYENIEIFDFKLTDDEIAYIDTFHTGARICEYPEARNNVHYPFVIEY